MSRDHRPQHPRSWTSFLALRLFAVLGIAMGVSIIGLIGYSIGSLWGESIDRAFIVENDLVPPPNTTPIRQESLWTRIMLRQWEQRTLAGSYWRALNDHDADKALSYLEDGYDPELESDIRTQVEQLRRSDGRLMVAEEREPFMINSEEAVMFFVLGDPPDTQNIQMNFVRVDDGWKIRSAEQAP